MQSDERTRQQVRQIVDALLAGRIGAILAARMLLPFIHADDSLASTEDRNLIIGIDSETDDLPVGDVRAEWDPGVLAEKDREIAKCESHWGESMKRACERILLQSSQSSELGDRN
jgi:hypothetical protein